MTDMPEKMSESKIPASGPEEITNQSAANPYRRAFLVTLVACIAFAGLAAWLWWRSPWNTLMVRQQTTPVTAPSPSSAPLMAAAQEFPAQSLEAPLAPIQLSPERMQRIGVQIGTVESKVVSDEIRTTGNVAVDETRAAYVQVRFSGWIQKVFADATYQYVRKGQPLFTIYSPDLVATQGEYIVAKQNYERVGDSSVPGVAAGAASLLAAAAERLRQWEVPAGEIERLESSGQVQQEYEVASSVSGYIIEREALANKYVQPDTRLYTVADLSSIWVFAQVFQHDLGRIRAGNRATLTVDTYPGRVFSGRVDFVYPDIDMATRTARVRLVFPNPDVKLMLGMFVNVTLRLPMGRQLTIPAGGVLQSGMRSIVFVDGGQGHLEPREVELGPRVGDEFMVLKGLDAGERIVTSANFLIDSESQLQAALGTFVPPPPGAGQGAPTAPQAEIEFTTDPSPPRKGNNTFRVRLRDAAGAPITGAEVPVTFYMPAMPAMGMGAMCTDSMLSDRGGGVYEGTGVLDSGGSWQVIITARREGQVIATRQLSVIATGGM